MRKVLDLIEHELEQAIAIAAGRGDNDLAYEFAVQLKEYRDYYKVESYES